ncbi:NADH-quinone oxidoreductase subunit NuoK [Thiotrichales bacterium 19S11-10]|nr:NADH-quinone oxidoreductase subunit NuoK [Thiotrichales bacterium 19S11-10]MCF6806976.1 NADH-quinone oxidoreductase subunit NuoK [Thiotrichales bacterium 19S9-11]MCF6810945.1 NADH-quinone oxidoreductase subunit NuoK [Thiotrichales bacterium 19S9-12]
MIELSLMHYLIFSGVLFVIGFSGVVMNRKNLLVLLMSIEIMLLAVNTNFVAFSQYMKNPVGEVFVFFILTVAAAEAAIGLAIIVAYFRSKGSISISQLNELKG